MELIGKYLAAWNETDPAARRALLADVWADDAPYTDPLADVRGRDALDGLIAAVQAQFPGLVFTLAGEVDAHHHLARFTWHLGPKDGAPVAIGFDVAEFTDTEITRVSGFLDHVPT
ncbi:SnoaL-like protein [Actinocorallia herbida]|uniref:SnoaL-like protein n=1 Tax=Actinocorallia herbida TaxID=58109 RepID=A0A3N1CT36_9ACTN|nr:nuclear transport factor 2 family protein [Actinocorallia herbida]ROO84466.1 SnoaL-like protein [Actinocorallia herbida]